MASALLWPTFALVLAIYLVWLAMFVQRTRHMRANPPAPDTFAHRDAMLRYFRPAESAANNFANLFEMPVVYFALVPLLLVTQHDTATQVVLAWLFVGFRAVHSGLHIGARPVPLRFLAYLASCVVLSAMWIGFAVDVMRVPGV